MTAPTRIAIARSLVVLRAAAIGIILSFAARPAQAQQTVTQTVALRVIASSQASVENAVAAVPMRSTGAPVAGTYAIATSEENQKISASLDRPMPRGTALSVTMAVPAGARALQGTALGTSPTDVVTDIPISAASRLPISYSVRGAAPLSKAEQRVVTYTFTAGI